jgi:hypothetical protein
LQYPPSTASPPQTLQQIPAFGPPDLWALSKNLPLHECNWCSHKELLSSCRYSHTDKSS